MRKKSEKSLVTGSVIALLIVISPYLFYLYSSFPSNDTWETSWFSYKSVYYQDISYLVWILMGKLIPLLFLLLWFFTCKHWWYHAIIVPIAMYTFQIYTTLNDEMRYHDEIEIYYLIPIMMVIIPSVYFIRIKLFDKLVHGIDLKKIEAELDEYERKEKEDSETDIIK
ncbi:hypothetical protein [Kordia periserrulae]|nr:hypothetical protein [Kordia periserrulae]